MKRVAAFGLALALAPTTHGQGATDAQIRDYMTNAECYWPHFQIDPSFKLCAPSDAKARTRAGGGWRFLRQDSYRTPVTRGDWDEENPIEPPGLIAVGTVPKFYDGVERVQAPIRVLVVVRPNMATVQKWFYDAEFHIDTEHYRRESHGYGDTFGYYRDLEFFAGTYTDHRYGGQSITSLRNATKKQVLDAASALWTFLRVADDVPPECDGWVGLIAARGDLTRNNWDGERVGELGVAWAPLWILFGPDGAHRTC